MSLDYAYRVRQPHRTGRLATVAGAVAEGGGLIGEVTAINVGRDSSVRESALAVEHHNQAERIVGLLNDLEGVEVLWSRDRALLRHGTLRSAPKTPSRRARSSPPSRATPPASTAPRRARKVPRNA